MNTPYVGRFAPSPSGPLHMGSLACALASYLDAKSHRGHWLVRMEDIDPPREQAGASTLILDTLQQHGLHWDGEVLFQSARGAAYEACLAQLTKAEISYRCNCTRARLKPLGHHYDGHCLRHPPPPEAPAALRLSLARARQALGRHDKSAGIKDRRWGQLCWDSQLNDDFVVRRKDGLYAYQLAVVVDDIYQGITHVVRGQDLLNCTLQQVVLIQLLNGTLPVYHHIPLVCDARGQKLSKQNHSPALNNSEARNNLHLALQHLQLHPPSALREADCEQILAWGIQHWPGADVV